MSETTSPTPEEGTMVSNEPSAEAVAPFVDHARTAHAAAETTYGERCRWCGHQHDPEEGRCDVHAHVGFGACPCPGEGLAVAYDKINAALYVAEQDCAELRGQLAAIDAPRIHAAGVAEGRAAMLREVGPLIDALARITFGDVDGEGDYSECVQSFASKALATYFKRDAAAIEAAFPTTGGQTDG